MEGRDRKNERHVQQRRVLKLTHVPVFGGDLDDISMFQNNYQGHHLGHSDPLSKDPLSKDDPCHLTCIPQLTKYKEYR
jgi:hypothetical protein